MPWTCPDTEAEALGWKYVAEGSAFGGRVIYRQLDYLFGEQESGRRFFGSSAAAGEWQHLCAKLDEVGADAACLDLLITGAANAFDRFAKLVGNEGPVHA